MPTIYLRPEDFSDAQVAVILEYLTRTSDAGEFAAQLALDIDEGLANRLVQTREQLGGRFENLQQIYDASSIGPERFTEIAVSLLDLHLPGAGRNLTPSNNALLVEVERLRELVMQLQSGQGSGAGMGSNTGKRVQLRVLQADVFVGQHLTLEIDAFDTATGRPLVDQAVTVSTNWGVLQYQQGYGRQQDAVVEVRTDIHGRARIRLRSPTYETLTQEQQLALEAALQSLDASASTPAAIREQLEALVLKYRLENNLELRKAIDIYFNSQKTAIIESVNRRLFSDSWGFHHALISAYLHLEDGRQELGFAQGISNGFVDGISTVKVRLKDWVGAWYQTYLDYLENGNQFSQRVQSLSSNGGDDGRIINGVLSEISRWSLGELGVAGSIIGEKSTESAVRKFLADDIQTLPEQQQLQLYSALSLAVKPTAVTQVGTLQAVADTQLTLVDEISDRVGSVEDISAMAEKVQQELDSFGSQFTDFQSGLNQFNTRFSAFNASLTGFNNNLTGFKADYNEFNASYGTFNTGLTQFNTKHESFQGQYGDFNNKYGTFGTQYRDFNTNYGTFRNELAEINVRHDSFEGRYEEFNNKYGTFGTQYRDFNTNYGTFKTELTETNARHDSFDSQYEGFSNKYDTFGTRYDDFNSKYGTVNSQITGFNNSYRTFRTELSDFNTRYGDFDNQYDDFSGKYGTFSSRYNDFNSKYGAINSDMTEFNANYSTFRTGLEDFNTKRGSFENQYGDFKTKYGTFGTRYDDFNSKYGNINSRMTNFDSSYSTFNNELGDFNAKYKSFGQRLDQFGSQLTSANANLSEVKSNIVKFNSSYAEYNSSLGNLRTEIGDLKANVNRIDAQVFKPTR